MSRIQERTVAFPTPQIVRVEPNAEQIGRKESELCCAHPNDADDDAVYSGNDRAVPQLFSYQKRGNDGQNTRQIIESKQSRTYLVK
jgi:hypothetical protein